MTKKAIFDKIVRQVIDMRTKVILVCEQCLSRNYTTEKNKLNTTNRVEIKKYCPKCNQHTVHKETK